MSSVPHALTHHKIHPITGRTSFFNPEPSARAPLVSSLFRGPWLSLPRYDLTRLIEPVQVVKPDFGRRELARQRRQLVGAAHRGPPKSLSTPPSDVEFISGTWLGHAGAFVQMPLSPSSRPPSPPDAPGFSSSTLKLLFDPIFSARASPVTWFGPKRMRGPPCAVTDLPGVDAVLISHNHYDHLDLVTILAVHVRWPHALFFVGLGNAAWFVAQGIPSRQVLEMDWWDELDLLASAFSAQPPSVERDDMADDCIRVTCVPAQHTSGRGLFDQRATLWCSWAVERFVPATASDSTSVLPTSATHRPAIALHPVDDLSAANASPRLSANSPSPQYRSGSSPRVDVDYTAWARTPLDADPFADQAYQVSQSARRLWIRKAAVYHAGDTGYRPIAGSGPTSPAFAALGQKCGHFDLAFIPIWRGGTLGFISALGLRLCHENMPTATHASPEDAVQIHRKIRSRNTVAVHFGTFQGSHLEELEALYLLEEACLPEKVRDLSDIKVGKRGRMGRLDIGETLVVQVQPLL